MHQEKSLTSKHCGQRVATVGLGNIAGVAIAVSLGGPGQLFG